MLRLVGGKISKTNAITITTPSSTIGIRGGICVLDVQTRRTISTFLFGNQMTVSGNGQRQEVTRPGSQVSTAAGSAPGAPTLVGAGGLSGQLSALEGGSGGGGGNSGGGSGGNTASNGGNADRGASNFSRGNSGQGPGAGGPDPLNGGNPPPQNDQRNNPLANGPGANPNNGSSNPVSTVTKVIVTNHFGSPTTAGRYLAEPAYSNFDRTNLSVTPTAANNKTIDGTGDLTTTTTKTTTTTTSGGATTTSVSSNTTGPDITLTVPGSGKITLPWQTDTLNGGFSIGGFTALGQTFISGTGYVSKNGEFFAYVFKTSGNNDGNSVGIFGGTPTTPTGTANFPTSGVAAFTMGNFGRAGRLPFADVNVGDDTQLQNAKAVSSLYAAYSTALAQTVGQAPPNARATALQAAISISGTGANQKSYMGVFIGTFFRDVTTTAGVVTTDNGMALSGHYSASYRLGATQQIARSVSAESTPLTGNGNAIYGTAAGGDGAASGIILTPDKLTSTASITGGLVSDVTTVRTSQASFNQPLTNLTGQDYFSVNAAYKTATPTGLGTTKTTQTLNGFVGGVVDQRDGSGNFSSRTVTTSDPTTLTLNTNAPNNRASVDVTTGNWDTSTSATFRLGGTTGGNEASSAFIDNANYAVRDRTSTIGNTTTVAGSDANVTSNTAMVSYSVAPAANLFTGAGVTPCTCAFMTWGWWGGDVSYSNSSTYNPGGRDRLNFATYVAGNLSVASDINALSSTATYNGHMVGNVVNGGNSYVQPGSYQNVWNFGNRSGIVTATFDGTTYGGGVTANTVMTGGATFGTNGTAIAAGGRSLTLNGAFFSGGTNNPVAGQGGSFAITGTAYKAGGTFAAQK